MRNLIIAATTLVPSAAFAGGYLIPDENARELALSQATVADQTGAEAIFRNVAALAGQDGLDISASAELLLNRTDWSDPTLGSASLIPQANTPPTASISFGDKLPNDMRWGAGIGFGVPAGGSLVWPNGWAGQEYIQSVSQKTYEMTGGAAFEPVPYVKLGASFVRYQVEEELHQEINFLDHYGDAGIGMAGGSSTYALAAEFHVPTIPLSLGVMYIGAGSTQITGHAHFDDVPPAFQTLLRDQGVQEHFTLPNQLYAGAAYEVIPHLTVMATFNFEHWSLYKQDQFIGDTGFTVTVPRSYNNAEVYRIGGEWAHVPFLQQLTLRLGALRSISDQPTDTLSPSLTDGDSWAVSVGGGYDVMPNLRIDVGYQHAFFDSVTASGTETLPGTYKTQVDLISLGVNWRIDLLGRSSPPPQ